MSRRVRKAADRTARPGTTTAAAPPGVEAGAGDTYFDKVVKYIPADIVGAWIAATGIINGAADTPPAALPWIVFAAAAILTPLWTWRQTEEPGKPPALTQILIATGAFLVWVFALGGPFATLDFYSPMYGSLALIFYTLVVGLIDPKEAGPER